MFGNLEKEVTQIKMPIFNEPNFTGEGLDEALAGVSQSVPIFTPMVLFFVFCIVFITGYKRQRETTGFADAPLWGTIAGVVTSMVALTMSLKSGLIQIEILLLVVTTTIGFAVWLFSSRDR